MTNLIRLQTREARKKLPPRAEPYWLELRRGLHIGYRKGEAGGSWVLREFKARAGKDGAGGYVKRRLGAADDDGHSDGAAVLSWDEATAKARDTDRPTVTKPTKLTLAQAAESYFATRSATTPHDHFTWKTFIEPKLGNRSVAELTTDDIEKWLAAQVPKTDDREQRRKAQATANRRFTVLRAILNSAYRKDPARVPSADAWRRVRGFAKADRARTRTATADEAKRLLAVLKPPLSHLAQGSLLAGLRLGELEALKVGDVGTDFLRVAPGKSGTGRTVPLNAEGQAFFGKLAAERPADELLFERMGRVRITRHMQAASKEAGLEPPVVFHDLRRSYGSLLLNKGVPADHIQELLGHADARMTRRHYAHLIEASLQKSVRKLPSFTDDVIKSNRVRK
jgi:integrase